MPARNLGWLIVFLAAVASPAAAQADLPARALVLERQGLYQEAARLLANAGEWEEAARMWRLAVESDKSLLISAAASLQRAPEVLHQRILRVVFLGRERDPAINRFASELLLGWGRPGEAWALLDAVLPENPADALVALERFAGRARALRSEEGLRSLGYALERMAQLSRGARGLQLRIEAARAFANAGELAAAQRMLEWLPSEGVSARSSDAEAVATLIRVLAEAGRVEEAEGHFYRWKDRLSPDVAHTLRERLARAWLLRSEFERAEGVLGNDSTVGAHAVRGWIALYRGDLGEAVRHFQTAGPYVTTRSETTRRARTLVLLDRLGVERDPSIGRALLQLERGDTLEAANNLAAAARRMAAPGGRAALLVLAGELAVRSGEFELAERVLLAATAADSAGPSAPAAHLALATAYIGLGRDDDAVERIEYLIIAFRESALVPRARRLLDELRGAEPRS